MLIRCRSLFWTCLTAFAVMGCGGNGQPAVAPPVQQTSVIRVAPTPAAHEALIAALIDLPEKPRDWLVHFGILTQAQADDPAISKKWNDYPPALSAPDGMLIAFWGSQARWKGATFKQLDDVTRRRLLAAALRYPADLADLLPLFDPADTAVHDQLKRLLDAPPKDISLPVVERSETDWQKATHRWLMLSSRYFSDELLAAAGNLKGNPESEAGVDNGDALEAQARRDWAAARPLAMRQTTNADPHVSTFAWAILHRFEASNGDQETATIARQKLLSVADKQDTPASSRALAIESLVQMNWPSEEAAQEKWVLQAMVDTPERMSEGNHAFQPFPYLLAQDRGRWVPILTRFVGVKDEPLHDVSINALLTLVDPVPDVLLRKLLPWLSDENWCGGGQRARFIAALGHTHLPEAIPGLIRVVEEKDNEEAMEAAKVLGIYKASAAAKALRASIARNVEHRMSDEAAKALVACGGVTDEELARAIEAYARRRIRLNAGGWSGEAGGPFGPRPRDEQQVTETIGAAAVEVGIADAAFSRLIARIDLLRRLEPIVASELDNLLAGMTGPAVDRYLLARAAEAIASDVQVIQHLAERSPEARKRIAGDLQRVANGTGAPAGIAAAVLADPDICQRILTGEDGPAIETLFATARLTRAPLSLETVGRIVTGTRRALAKAAEAYLRAEDSPCARQIVLSRHHGEGLILGPTEWHLSVERLGHEAAPEHDGTREIFALLSGGFGGNDGQRIIRIKNDGSATLTIEGSHGRSQVRTLTAAEMADLRAFVSATHFDDLPMLPIMAIDGEWYEYVHVTANGGRRVSMNNPDLAAGSPYDLIVRRFQAMEKAATATVRYDAVSKAIPGSRVLVTASTRRWVEEVWRDGNDFRLLYEVEDEGPAWHAWREGKIIPAADSPPGRYKPLTNKEWPRSLNCYARDASLSLLADGSFVCLALGADHSQKRLWTFKPGQKPELLAPDEKEYGSPVVTPDGKWVIASRSGDDGENGDWIVRIDTAGRKQFRVDLPAGRYYEAVGYLPPHLKVLLSGRVSGTDDVIYLLLDPATGVTERVTGDFFPLAQDWVHALLHPAAEPDEFWVALPTELPNELESFDETMSSEPTRTWIDRTATRIGRYNARTFRFTPVVVVPVISATSRAIWVDRSQRELLIAVNQDVLSIPLGGVKRDRAP